VISESIVHDFDPAQVVETSVTAIGDTVNAAARLESEAKALGASVIISNAVLHHLPAAYQTDARAQALELRGKTGVLQAHNISASLRRSSG
jgi:class 3 adenylate cyclase